MTIRNLHLAPGRWELKELKVFSNIFGELWTCIETCAWPHLTPFQLTCKPEFTAEMRKLKEFSFKASCSLNPHSIPSSLSKSPPRGQSRQKSRVLTAQCRIQRYRSTLVPWFQTHCKAWAGISSDVDVSIMCWSPHNSRPHQMNLCYFIFHSCSLLPSSPCKSFQHLLSSTRLKVAIRCPWF